MVCIYLQPISIPSVRSHVSILVPVFGQGHLRHGMLGRRGTEARIHDHCKQPGLDAARNTPEACRWRHRTHDFID